MPRHNHAPVRQTARGNSSRPSAKRVTQKRARIGQHFLADPLIARDIVDAATIDVSEDIIEVGPGAGALTEYLVQRAAHVTAVELDEELASRLRTRFAGEPCL